MKDTITHQQQQRGKQQENNNDNKKIQRGQTNGTHCTLLFDITIGECWYIIWLIQRVIANELIKRLFCECKRTRVKKKLTTFLLQ